MSSALNEALAEVSLGEIGLENRVANKLEGKSILNLLDLLNSTEEELLSISNFGDKMLDETLAAANQKLTEVRSRIEAQEESNRLALIRAIEEGRGKINGNGEASNSDNESGTRAIPGTEGKLAEMRRRLAEGEPIHQKGDRQNYED